MLKPSFFFSFFSMSFFFHLESVLFFFSLLLKLFKEFVFSCSEISLLFDKMFFSFNVFLFSFLLFWYELNRKKFLLLISKIILYFTFFHFVIELCNIFEYEIFILIIIFFYYRMFNYNIKY